MARNGRRARREPPDPKTLETFARRVGWVVLAGSWVFLLLALFSFDASDWPSHAVAVHNDPPRNLCGTVGAFVAYHGLRVCGLGAWVALIAAAGFLWAKARRVEVSHSLLRIIGVVLIALSLAGFHALLWPEVGRLPGAEAGLIAAASVGALTERFSSVGTALILLAALGIGAVVAVDWLVGALGRGLGRVPTVLATMPKPRMPSLANLRLRPEGRLATVASASGLANGSHIDRDAGGIGATEAFDPDTVLVSDMDSTRPDEEPEEADGTHDEPARRRLSRSELAEKLKMLPVRMSASRKTIARDEDIPRQAPATRAGGDAAQEHRFEDYEFPGLDLLEDPESNYSARMEAFVRKQARQLEEALQTYGIDGEVTAIESGPVVTLYSIELAPGTKVARVQSVASDVARSLRAHNIRIVPNMVGKTTVGIEVPNLYKERVRLKELMNSGQAAGMHLPMFLGKDASGEPLVADLTRMPHMLIAGTTGSGKSVCINSIIMSWLYTKRPNELKLILVDPKMVEMSQFQDIPHLMCPIVTETSKATAILEWAVDKMEERYELLREAGVRNVEGYNQLDEAELHELFQPANEIEAAKIPKKLPYIVFIIDELADLIMTHTEAEKSIVRIAQKARAVGLHLILATQRPQANVVTGLIKSNMPCRVSFKVASGMDSRIVLDQKGAELLLGQGDMLFLTPHTTEVTRSQGTLVTDGEIREVARWLRGVATPRFEPTLLRLRPEGAEGEVGIGERDPLFDESVRIMIESKRGSVSLLQRRLAIGYTRASRLVDQMAVAGILGDHKGSVAREVMITLEEWEQIKAMEEAAETSGALVHDEETEADDVEAFEVDLANDDEAEAAADEDVAEDEYEEEEEGEAEEELEEELEEPEDENEEVEADDEAEDEAEEEVEDEEEEEEELEDEDEDPPVVETPRRRARSRR